MKGSFTIEAAFFVPLLIMILIFALRSGIGLFEETKNLAEKMGKSSVTDCVELFYAQYRMSEIGDLWNGN